MKTAEEMTRNVHCVAPKDYITNAYQLMTELDVRHCPVVESDGSVVGLLSDRDIFRLAHEKDDHLFIPNKRVDEVMTKDVVTCDENTRIGDVADKMIEKHIDSLPVTNKDGVLVGFITSTDLMMVLRRKEGVTDVVADTYKFHVRVAGKVSPE